MSVALHRLFGFGHTQSDDVAAKSTKKGFLANVTNLLKTESIVIADRSVQFTLIDCCQLALTETTISPSIEPNWSL
jgi:tRNA splicing ligase